MSIPCIIWPLIAGLVGALLGYLIGKMAGGNSTSVDTSEADSLRKKNATLEADLAECRSKNVSLNSKASAVGTVAMAAAAPAFDAAGVKAIFGKKIKQDDLKLVEGIGPKIEELFHNAGVKTWAALGSTTFEECKKILNDAGSRYQMHNPATWPDQAQMAADGKFAELKKWQDELDGGK